MAGNSRAQSEVEKLRAKLTKANSSIEELSNQISELKDTNNSLMNDVTSLKAEVKLKTTKLLKCSAAGTIIEAESILQEGKIKELTIKLEGISQQHKSALKEANKYEGLYHDAKQLYENQNRSGILKAATSTDRAIIQSKIADIVSTSCYSPPPLKKSKISGQTVNESIEKVKISVLQNMDKLGMAYATISVKRETEAAPSTKLVEFRQIFQTNDDGSLALISSTPVIKKEYNGEVITLE